MLDPATLYPASSLAAPPDCEPNFHVKRPCKTFSGAFFCGMEWDEWQLVNALVRPENTVLELGARFGTTSCVLAQKTQNSGGVVSVEPDKSVHNLLLRNRDRHNCSFHVLRGVVGDSPIALSKEFGHYATQTRLARPNERNSKHVLPSITVARLEEQIGRKFDTLLIDCEGCIEQFFVGSNRKLLNQLKLILMEEDTPHTVDYAAWHGKFRKHGFERIWKIRDTFDNKAPWSRNISHSAWRRGGLSGSDLPTCEQYRQKAKLTPRWLECLDPASNAPMLP